MTITGKKAVKSVALIGATTFILSRLDKSPKPVCEGCGSPQDLDGDGLYEDVNGDGVFDFFDVVRLFRYWEDVGDNESDTHFDFNGDGMFTKNDVDVLE